MLPLLIIAATVALVVGPIMLMRPTAGQQKLARLRSRALELDLRVHMMPLPESVEGRRQCAAYCLPWSTDDGDAAPWLLVRGQYDHDIHFSGHWQWSDDQTAPQRWHGLLMPRLAELPESVVAVGNGPQGLCVYWRERGPERQLERLAEWLKLLREARLSGGH